MTTRSCDELIRFATAQPRDALVAVTTAEALQFGPWITAFLLRDQVGMRICGRPCLIVDWPPVDLVLSLN